VDKEKSISIYAAANLLSIFGLRREAKVVYEMPINNRAVQI